MEINRKFFEFILPVLKDLENKLACDFVVFGSAPLYLTGVLNFGGRKDLNDLDIVLRDDLSIPPGTEKVLFHNDPKQAIYKLRIRKMSVDMGAPWPGRKKIHNKIFKDPIVVDGFKFANLEIVKEWKELMVKEYGRDKDKNYLKKIEIHSMKNKKK